MVSENIHEGHISYIISWFGWGMGFRFRGSLVLMCFFVGQCCKALFRMAYGVTSPNQALGGVPPEAQEGCGSNAGEQ